MKLNKVFFLILGFVFIGTFVSAQTDASSKSQKEEKQVKEKKDNSVKTIELKQSNGKDGAKSSKNPKLMKMKRSVEKSPALTAEKKADRASMKKRLMQKKPASKKVPKKE